MAILSDQQLEFLESQNIPLSRVFDATGMSKKEYQDAMRSLGMEFAYGVSPCKKSGHTLRTRAGHCVQCDTSKVAYQLRHNESGLVYVAYSNRLKLAKIGVAKDIDDRLRNLNSQGYGGAKDWTVKFHKKFNKAGQVEFEIQKTLEQFREVRSYTKTGNAVECRELFNCEPDMVVKLIKGHFSH